MSTPPRRRRPAAPNAKPDGGGWLPTIAMGLGVVVAGLAIGALVAVFMQRGGGGPAPVATPLVIVTSTPGTAFTPRPIAIATFEPPRTPRPSPSPTPTAPSTAEPTPSAPPSPRPTQPKEAASALAARPERVAQAVPVPLSSATPTMHAAPNPPTSNPRAASVDTEPTSAPAAPTAAVAGTPGPQAETPSTYDEHASAVVRRYVDALIRGDEKTAYSALGGSGTLSEQAFLDSSARIVLLKVTRIDASNASVGCEIATAKGNYYGTYHVTAASSGPYISQHDYIKV
jgi:hypothetical protein